MKDFKKELETLLNSYGMDNETHMPDFILADLLISIIDVTAVANKRTLDWHGTDSICHCEGLPEKNQYDREAYEDDSPELNQMIGWNECCDKINLALLKARQKQEMGNDTELSGEDNMDSGSKQREVVLSYQALTTLITERLEREMHGKDFTL